jgi:hypothetical protein
MYREKEDWSSPAHPPPGSPGAGSGTGVVHVQGEGGLVCHDGGEVLTPQLLNLSLQQTIMLFYLFF